jgi:glucan phosphoethanolaminetransferase (alkaline phosphatase superfamily)
MAEKTVQSPETEKVPFSAKAKEWGRKKIVALKRAPHKIPLFVYAIVSIYFLLCLATYSEAILTYAPDIDYLGTVLFINILLSILIIVSFLNAFPKRKKPVIPMIALVSVMTVIMIVCDIIYMVILTGNYNTVFGGNPQEIIKTTVTLSLVHIILLAIAAVVFALLPVYSKLILKINTKTQVDSATSSMGKIDINED